MISSRFTVAIHILSLLAYLPGHAVSANVMAGSVNTTPRVIRQQLSLLRKGGFVYPQGKGWELARPAEAITLLDVYIQVEPGPVFAFHQHIPNPLCPVGMGIQRGIAGYYQRAQGALEQELAKVTIAQVLHEVLEKDPHANHFVRSCE